MGVDVPPDLSALEVELYRQESFLADRRFELDEPTWPQSVTLLVHTSQPESVRVSVLGWRGDTIEGAGEAEGSLSTARPLEPLPIVLGRSTCGGGTSESDAQMCARLGKDCDNVTAADLCGVRRTVSCGGCPASSTCGGGGTANVCGCTPNCSCTTESCPGGKVCVAGVCRCPPDRTECGGVCIDPASPGALPSGAKPRTIALGVSHTCVVADGGTVRCVGYGGAGELGDGNGEESAAPVSVTGLSGVAEIVAGDSHTCARLSGSGQVKCWGYGEYGQLGNGSESDAYAPVPVAGPLSGAVQLAAGPRYTCARSNDGTVRCWGENGSGQFGFTTIDAVCLGGSEPCELTPKPIPGVNDAIDLVSGEGFVCVRRASGTVQCWGSVPSGAAPSGGSALDAGGGHICTWDVSQARCVGRNDYGQLGDGTTTRRTGTGVFVWNLTNIAELSAGGAHTCVRKTNGLAFCWGWNRVGDLGDGTLVTRTVPTQVLGLCDVREIRIAHSHTCARTGQMRTYCWGHNYNYQLGDGTRERRIVPTLSQF